MVRFAKVKAQRRHLFGTLKHHWPYEYQLGSDQHTRLHWPRARFREQSHKQARMVNMTWVHIDSSVAALFTLYMTDFGMKFQIFLRCMSPHTTGWTQNIFWVSWNFGFVSHGWIFHVLDYSWLRHSIRGIGILKILSNGSKYVDGDLRAKGGEGYGFFGTFTTSDKGELMTSTIVSAGHYYFYDPDVILYHAGSLVPQNKSVTGFDIISGIIWLLFQCSLCMVLQISNQNKKRGPRLHRRWLGAWRWRRQRSLCQIQSQ